MQNENRNVKDFLLSCTSSRTLFKCVRLDNSSHTPCVPRAGFAKGDDKQMTRRDEAWAIRLRSRHLPMEIFAVVAGSDYFAVIASEDPEQNLTAVNRKNCYAPVFFCRQSRTLWQPPFSKRKTTAIAAALPEIGGADRGKYHNL